MITSKILLLYLLHSSNLSGIDTSNIDSEQALCLAQNVYYESASEDIKGQYAVASVTMNRVHDSRFPSTVCEVVRQSITNHNHKTCAFSWVCSSNGKDIPLNNKDGSVNQVEVDRFQVAALVAIKTLAGDTPDYSKGAEYFHNPHTSHPSWANTLKRTVSIGNHDFYRW